MVEAFLAEMVFAQVMCLVLEKVVFLLQVSVMAVVPEMALFCLLIWIQYDLDSCVLLAEGEVELLLLRHQHSGQRSPVRI